jgi:hypothetical protein
MMNLLAVTSGTAAVLLWLVLAGIIAAAVVLYWPRQFSGPLTALERGLARRRLRGRSLAVTLATPVLTIAGFVLLLPAFVHLKVGDGADAPECAAPSSRLSAVAWTQSTSDWVEAVQCDTPADITPEQLAARIVEAAVGGFERASSCTGRLLPLDRASVELSLVELAARAYMLTEVDIDTGPRHTDPDPWDIMMRTLDARGIATCRSARDVPAGEGELLRLGPAFVTGERDEHLLDVSVLVRGPVCGRDLPGRLLASTGEVIATCSLVADPEECAADGERVVGMRVTCDGFSAQALRGAGQRSGLKLSVGSDETRVYLDLPVTLEIQDPRLEALFDSARSSPAFRDSLARHGLKLPTQCRACGGSSVSVRVAGSNVVIEKKGAESLAAGPLHRLMPDQGPFSWHGVNVPKGARLRCSDGQVILEGVAAFLEDARASRDPTVMYPLSSTIVWAANVLTNSACEVRTDSSAAVGSRPLLNAEQLDRAVAGIRRRRETLGLVCLGLALVALALGLRRSVT